MSLPRIGPATPLVLGSGSPRRREILTSLGVPFRVLVGDGSEEREPGEAPDAYVERIVGEKLARVAGRLRERSGPAAAGAAADAAATAGATESALLVADTIVELDGEVLGKPRDRDDALSLVSRLAGVEHIVKTRYAIAVAGAWEQAALARTVVSRVRMRQASRSELERYVATGEGLDKAGAYALQGLGAFLVESVSGSPTNVIGLPACEVILDLGRLGLLGPYP